MGSSTCVCQRCGESLPLGSRSDRRWCSRACQSWAQRRLSGAVVENGRDCPSCGVSLAGLHANAVVCRAPKCRAWSRRHPGELHPSVSPRFCAHCGTSIDEKIGKAKYCGARCKDNALIAADRAGHNARQREWQSTGKARAYRRAYQKANAAKRRQYARESRARNPERYKKYWSQWASENVSHCREIARLRRARKNGNAGSVGVSLRDWRRLVRRYGGACAYCGEAPERLHMDHVVPIARGGRHAIGNVLPACDHCNFTKHAAFLVEWRRRVSREAKCLVLSGTGIDIGVSAGVTGEGYPSGGGHPSSHGEPR